MTKNDDGVRTAQPQRLVCLQDADGERKRMKRAASPFL